MSFQRMTTEEAKGEIRHLLTEALDRYSVDLLMERQRQLATLLTEYFLVGLDRIVLVEDHRDPPVTKFWFQLRDAPIDFASVPRYEGRMAERDGLKRRPIRITREHGRRVYLDANTGLDVLDTEGWGQLNVEGEWKSPGDNQPLFGMLMGHGARKSEPVLVVEYDDWTAEGWERNAE